MLQAKLVSHGAFILIVEIEVAVSQLLVLFDDFVEDVDVQWQSLRRIELLYQLTADGAANTVLMMEFADAVGTESVPTVNQDSGNALADVVFEAAELADVEATRLVVQLNNVDLFWAAWV